jgi:hypothetical protein
MEVLPPRLMRIRMIQGPDMMMFIVILYLPLEKEAGDGDLSDGFFGFHLG